MATTDRIPSPQSPVSQDDGGLWMKMDVNPVMEHREMTQGNPFGEKPQEDTKVALFAPTVRYYAMIDDEGEDDVFIPPPPPPYMAPSPPTGGSRGITATEVNKSSVTVTNGAVGVTEAKANPSGLGWHHGEKQLMATQNKTDEVTVNDKQIYHSKERMDTISLSEEKDPTPSTEQDQTTMQGTRTLPETCIDPSGGHQQGITTRKSPCIQESKEGSEETVTMSEQSSPRPENCPEENNLKSDKYPKRTPSYIEESTGKKTDYDASQTEDDKGRTKRSSEFKGESEDVRCLVETSVPTLPGLNAADDFNQTQKKTRSPPDLCKHDQNKTSAAEGTSEKEQHVDTTSLDYNLTKKEWVRRNNSTSEITLPHLPKSRGSTDPGTEPLPPSEVMEERNGDEDPEKVRMGKTQDGNRSISTDIQQGKELLQRLQVVQQRQDEQQLSDSPLPSKHIVQETANQTRHGEGERGVFGIEEEDLGAGGGDRRNEEEKGRGMFNTDKKQGEKTNKVEKDKSEKSQSKETVKNAIISSSAMPAQPSHHRIARAEADTSDDDQSDSGVSADFSPVNTHEIPSAHKPILSTHHQLSTTVTSMERETHQKLNLQRAKGVFDLVEDPDVLEIPFKTNILPNKDGPGQSSDWQFSGEKMKKEISQEIQRELVLVNQGKIPGEYSKGAIPQLKETKMLFEAFQQDNTEGPTRHRKPSPSLLKDHIYPSVLERTRSLEMLSQKRRPISRTQSLRQSKTTTSEMEGSSENPRSKNPSGVSREKTRSSPYPKQLKQLHLHRSMDSLNIDDPTSNMENESQTRERTKSQESPILKENPFFKLRPALALKPEVEKDIQESKEREEELRRQRSTLYGEIRQNSVVKEGSSTTGTLDVPGARQQPKGKLDRIWPPPSNKDQMKSGQTQQEAKVPRAGGQRPPLWQRWESGLINGQPPKEKD